MDNKFAGMTEDELNGYEMAVRDFTDILLDCANDEGNMIFPFSRKDNKKIAKVVADAQCYMLAKCSGSEWYLKHMTNDENSFLKRVCNDILSK